METKTLSHEERVAYDVYAAQALNALIMRADTVAGTNPFLGGQSMAQWAGEYAMWMLAERAKRTGTNP